MPNPVDSRRGNQLFSSSVFICGVSCSSNTPFTRLPVCFALSLKQFAIFCTQRHNEFLSFPNSHRGFVRRFSTIVRYSIICTSTSELPSHCLTFLSLETCAAENANGRGDCHLMTTACCATLRAFPLLGDWRPGKAQQPISEAWSSAHQLGLVAVLTGGKLLRSQCML